MIYNLCRRERERVDKIQNDFTFKNNYQARLNFFIESTSTDEKNSWQTILLHSLQQKNFHAEKTM